MKSKIKVLAEKTDHYEDLLGGILLDNNEPVITVKEALDAMQEWGEQVGNELKKWNDNYPKTDSGEQQQVTGELYWKQRCLAAEELVYEGDYYGSGNPRFNKWQQLKNQEVEPGQQTSNQRNVEGL